VDHRAGLDDVEKRKFLNLPGLELRPLGRPARSQSLYRLSYPGSDNNVNESILNSSRGGIVLIQFLSLHRQQKSMSRWQRDIA
jgi:hypothetical protein